MDTNRDCTRGQWTRQGNILVSDDQVSRVEFPTEIAESSYELRVEFSRDRGGDCFVVSFPVGDTGCEFILCDRGGKFSGLDLIDGIKLDAEGNPTARSPSNLENGRRYVVRIVVRVQGKLATINCFLDGDELVAWKGNVDSLSQNGDWKTAPHRASVTEWQSPATVYSARVGPIAPVPVPRTATGSVKFPLNEWINVLRLVDPERDRVKGVWVWKGAELTCESKKNGRICLPVIVDGGYDLVVDFTRTAGSGDVATMLSIGSHSCAVTLSGWGGAASGLMRLDGNDPDNSNNPIAVRPGRLENGHRYRLLIGVRNLPRNRASIDLSLDGKPYLPHWEGDPAALSESPYWGLGVPGRIGFGSQDSDVIFHSVRLRMISGHVTADAVVAESLSPQSAPAPVISDKPTVPQAFPHGQWIDVLGSVDTAKNALQGTWSRSGSEITCDAQDNTKIEIPVVVSGSYELETEFTRTAGDGDVNTIFPVGSHQCLMQISADGGGSSGLNTVDGRNCQDHDNPTHIDPGTIQTNHRYRLLIKVQIMQPDRASIDVALDGKRYLPHWEGNPQSLGLDQQRWTLPNLQELGLGLYKDRVTFHSVRLRVGKGEAAPAAAVPAVVKTDRVGGGGGGPFADIGPSGSLLVGMHVVHNGVINIVTPVFRTGKGDIGGPSHGSNGGTNEEAIAKPGYAVGGMTIKSGNSVDGFRLVFMRIRGRRLDPKDSYESQWFGGQGGERETKLGSDGNLALGIFGSNGTNIDSIGLIVEVPPAAAGKSP